MYQVPPQPKIYHILHIDKLASVIASGGLWCDAEMQQRGGGGTVIGMGSIKERRLNLPVKCYTGDLVGDYVPFYFCPRSIMLYLIYQANHPELTYRGGQRPIVHLQADLNATIAWAEAQGRRWAFSLSNAGAVYAEFRARVDQLNQINWHAIAATQWSQPDLKEGKQAEFLVHNFFPWNLVEQIGVHSQNMVEQTIQVIQATPHQPRVVQKIDWYY